MKLNIFFYIKILKLVSRTISGITFHFKKSEKMRLLKSGLLLGSTWGAYFLDKGIPDRRCKSDDPTTCVTIDLVSLTSHKPGTTLFSEIY